MLGRAKLGCSGWRGKRVGRQDLHEHQEGFLSKDLIQTAINYIPITSIVMLHIILALFPPLYTYERPSKCPT